MSNHVGEPLCLSPMVTAAVPGLTCTLAESPVWDDRRHMLFWVDIPAGRVHGLGLAENHHCHWDMGEPVSAIGLTEGERILVAGKSGIWTLSPETGDRTLWCAIAEFGGGMRPNDGKIGRGVHARQGRLRQVNVDEQHALTCLVRQFPGIPVLIRDSLVSLGRRLPVLALSHMEPPSVARSPACTRCDKSAR